MQKSRRTGGARAGGFPGADKILAQFEKGASRRRVGLRPEGRAPVREGAMLFDATRFVRADRQGHLGRFWTEPQCPGCDGLSALDILAGAGTQIFAEVRGQRLPLQVAAMPFVPNTYKR